MGWVPMEACLVRATAQRAAVAGGTLHLFKSTLSPDGNTLKAAYVAAEADYDDYAAITVATWFAPILAPDEGYQIACPSQQFAQGATDPATENIIGGYFYLSSTGALMYAGLFDTPITIAAAHAGFDLEILDKFVTGFGG